MEFNQQSIDISMIQNGSLCLTEGQEEEMDCLNPTSSCGLQQNENGENGDEKETVKYTEANIKHPGSNRGYVVYKQVFTIICFLIFVISFGLCLLAAVVYVNSYKKTESTNSGSLFCLSCHRLVSLKSDIFQKIVRVENGKMEEICCGDNSNALAILVDEYFKRRLHMEGHVVERKMERLQNATFLPKSRNQPSVIAHVVLENKETNVPEKNGMYNINSWTYQNRNNYKRTVTKGVTYNHGRLRVDKPGIYYVYSQVRFLEPPPGALQAYHSSSLSHYVYKISKNIPNGGERRLLQSSRTRCSSPNSYFEHTSYLGAAVWLEKEDQILVRVNNLTSVANDSKSTYLGLYILDEETNDEQ